MRRINTLNDITLDRHYSALCGYTEGDLDQVFAPELAGLEREAIRTWYHGYHWTGEAVYNPFDLLLLLGRLDMAVRFNGHLYLFEFKVVELASSGEALEQIKERGYADKYRVEGLPIHLIGVEFNRELRSVVGFAVETL